MATTRNQNKNNKSSTAAKSSSPAKKLVQKQKAKSKTPKKPSKPQTKIVITTPPPKTGPQPHDLCLGAYGDVFTTDQELKKFGKKGIRSPAKLLLVKNETDTLPLAAIDSSKIVIRNLIIRMRGSSVKALVDKDNMGASDSDYDKDEVDYNDDDRESVVKHLEKQFLTAKNHYKPTRVFICIETHGYFGACLAFCARRNKYVQAVLNEVGKIQITDFTIEEQRQKFAQRLGYWLIYQHPYSRPLQELSDDKIIVAGDL